MTTRSRSQVFAVDWWTESRLVTIFIVGLIVWLPLQTPIGIAAYQYGGFSAGAVRGLILAKDVLAMGAVLFLLVRHGRGLRIQWFDLAGAAFVVILAIYALVPILSGNGPSLNATIAGLRQFVLPMEIYALGRLAAAAGVRFGLALRVFVVVSACAAAFTVILFVFVPVNFWVSSLDLVRYVRDVQGLPGAKSLWDISVVGTYGQTGAEPIARAIGPFTHPVGTAAYFILPVALATAALFASKNRQRSLAWAAIAALSLAAVIFTISRGGWIAAAVAILVLGVCLRRARAALIVLGIVAAFVWFVPPFSISLNSALSGIDGSAILHKEAVENGVQAITQNPLGSGVGRSDLQFGQTFGGGAGEGYLLENTYLSIFVATGPLGLLTFAAWLAGILNVIRPSRGSFRLHWPQLAYLAATLGLAVASLTSNTLMRFTTGASFWLLFGLLVDHLPTGRPLPISLPWRRSLRTATGSNAPRTAGRASGAPKAG